MTADKAKEARKARIREILSSWPVTTAAQRARAVAILATAKPARTGSKPAA